MRIYVASSWRNPWQPGVVNRLRRMGHEVYDFRNPGPDQHGFSWREIDDDWQDWNHHQYRQKLTHQIAERGFRLDMDALESSDACILVQPCGTSSHLELGWSVGARKNTAILFPVGMPTEPVYGHSCSTEACYACGDTNGCHLPGRLDKIEPELMAKMADSILIGEDELVSWVLAVSRGWSR